MFSRLFKKTLLDTLPKVQGKYLKNVLLSKHTWFGVGGPAEVMYIPHDIEDLSRFMKMRPRNVPLCIIGGGSNILVRDGGVPGVVIKLDSPYFCKVKLEENSLLCYAGVRNVELKKILLAHERGGLEFLCSIPGCIGGSIKTNAGCFGRCVRDVLLSALVMDGEGEVKEILPEDFQLSYRSSFFPEDWIILAIRLKTENAKRDDVAAVLAEQKAYRVKNQPYNEKTAGSTFKNPEGLRAWELIKKSGCAQWQVGGAKVSEKHCNFLINTGDATAADIEKLGNMIVSKVKQQTSITLEWEVKKMGIPK